MWIAYSSRGIIPAYAGSTTMRSFLPGGAADHPRIRGEHCQMPLAILPWTGSSPHTRGAPCENGARSAYVGIIPAYAGSTPSTSGQIGGDADHPRIRGEHISECATRNSLTGSSPHTRGALRG